MDSSEIAKNLILKTWPETSGLLFSSVKILNVLNAWHLMKQTRKEFALNAKLTMLFKMINVYH